MSNKAIPTVLPEKKPVSMEDKVPQEEVQAPVSRKVAKKDEQAPPPVGFNIGNSYFGGGDPDDRNNWIEKGTIIGDKAFAGGDPNDIDNWTDTSGVLYSAEDKLIGPILHGAGEGLKVIRKAVKPLDIAMMGLQKGGEMVNTLVGVGANAAMPGLITPEEVKTGLNPLSVFDPNKKEVPSLKELAMRAGIPEGPTLSRVLPVKPGGILDVSPLGVATGYVQGRLDPTPTFIKYGGSIKNLPRNLKNLGKNVYARSWAKQDLLSELRDKTPVSDVMWRNKVSGSTPIEIADSVEGAINNINKVRSGIFERNPDLGDVGAALSRAKANIAYLEDIGTPTALAKAAQMRSELETVYGPLKTTPESFTNIPGTPEQVVRVPKQRSAWEELENAPPYTEQIIPGTPGQTIYNKGFPGVSKQQLQRLKQEVYQKYKETNDPDLRKFYASQLAGLNEEIFKGVSNKRSFWDYITGNKSDLERLKELDSDQSSLLFAKDKIKGRVIKGADAAPFSSVEGMIGGTVAATSHDPLSAIGKTATIIGAKRAAEGTKIPSTLMRVGRDIHKINPARLIPDPLISLWEKVLPPDVLEKMIRYNIEKSTNPAYGNRMVEQGEEQ